jgi:hypothetical protein
MADLADHDHVKREVMRVRYRCCNGDTTTGDTEDNRIRSRSQRARESHTGCMPVEKREIGFVSALHRRLPFNRRAATTA